MYVVRNKVGHFYSETYFDGYFVEKLEFATKFETEEDAKEVANIETNCEVFKVVTKITLEKI